MKKLYFLIALLGYAYQAYSQQQPEVTTPSEQPKVIIYNASEPKNSFKHSEQLIKMNLLSALNGDIGAAYERKIGEKISVEGGAGVTVKNFAQGWLVNFFEANNEYTKESISRQHNLGYSIMAAVKYYPGGAIDGFYFAPEIRHRRHNSEATHLNYRGTLSEHMNLTDFKMTFGYVNYLDDHIFIEYNFGLGIRHRNQSMLVDKEVTVNNVRRPYVGQEDIKMNAPLISLGLKIGFTVPN